MIPGLPLGSAFGWGLAGVKPWPQIFRKVFDPNKPVLAHHRRIFDDVFEFPNIPEIVAFRYCIYANLSPNGKNVKYFCSQSFRLYLLSIGPRSPFSQEP